MFYYIMSGPPSWQGPECCAREGAEFTRSGHWVAGGAPKHWGQNGQPRGNKWRSHIDSWQQEFPYEQILSSDINWLFSRSWMKSS